MTDAPFQSTPANSPTSWASVPRQKLGHWPTPLEPLRRLSAELGGPTIWLKRDDCSGLATGGNKTRKLETLLADALAQSCDTVITFGAVQSNHARQTAAACAKLGLQCHLLLSRQVESKADNYESGGNVLLDNLLGAHLHLLQPAAVKDYLQALEAQLQERGRKVYRIPAGGSNALGALGYSYCAAELAEQFTQLQIAPQQILHASSSAGTQAGLLYGFAELNTTWKPEVLGINVYHDDPTHLQARIEKLWQDMIQQFGSSAAVKAADIHVNHAYLGPGYGQPTAETAAAIRMAAEFEGILFDPAYSGKALAAMIDQINLGNFNSHKDVVLIHTGGAAALNVYSDTL